MKRIRIDRLDVHMGDVSPQAARAAAAELGPAIGRQLAQSPGGPGATPQEPPPTLADRAARQVAVRIRSQKS